MFQTENHMILITSYRSIIEPKVNIQLFPQRIIQQKIIQQNKNKTATLTKITTPCRQFTQNMDSKSKFYLPLDHGILKN